MSKYLTIRGFTKLTERQAIEMSVKHVLGNGKPSISSGGGCFYGGCGCAAAPFLRPGKRNDADNADTLYDTGNTSWHDLVEGGLVQDHLRHTIKLLQNCHDESESFYRRYAPKANATEEDKAIASEKFIEEFKKRLVFYSLVKADDPLLQS